MAYRQKHPYIAQIYHVLKFAASEKLSKLIKRKKAVDSAGPGKGNEAPAGKSAKVRGFAVKRKNPMPSYYGKNIVRHTQKKFLQRKELEASREKRRDDPTAEAVESGKEQ